MQPGRTLSTHCRGFHRYWPLLLVLLAGLASQATASAHARYDHGTPGPGQVLSTAPAQVDIYTTEELRKSAGANLITVTDSAGKQVQIGQATVDDSDRKHFSVGLNPSLAGGRYVVDFTTLSDDDGDTDHGRYAFYVGRDPTPKERSLDARLVNTSASAQNDSHTGLIAGIIVAIAAALLLVAGGALLLRRRRTTRV